jgi:hypothetical protein
VRRAGLGERVVFFVREPQPERACARGLHSLMARGCLALAEAVSTEDIKQAFKQQVRCLKHSLLLRACECPGRAWARVLGMPARVLGQVQDLGPISSCPCALILILQALLLHPDKHVGGGDDAQRTALVRWGLDALRARAPAVSGSLV